MNRLILKQEFLRNYGLPNDPVMLFSVGELNQNKNHQIVIKAISKLKNDKVHYFIAGEGEKRKELLDLAKELGVSEKLHLLGYRSDVSQLLRIMDIYCLPSIREGLNVSLMEAIASGIPCIASNIRGNTDLIEKNIGELFAVNAENELLSSIQRVIDARETYGVSISKQFQKTEINKKMSVLYRDISEDKKSG